MLAAMFYAPLDLRLEDCPIPTIGPGEILLQVAAATTCGTDVKTYRRGHPLLFRETPAGFGHEVAGIVAAKGAEVQRFHEGDAVVVANSAPCLQCFYCHKQRYSLCENLLFLNGAYAEYLRVPERIVQQNVYRLPASTSLIAAALTEPLACAVHGIDASEITEGDTIAIIGAGPLGLLLTAVAKQRGAFVILAGRGSERLTLGKHFGADAILDSSGLSLEEQAEALRNLTEQQRGVDCAIEAVGTPETWSLAVQITRRGGLVNFFGGCANGTQITLETRPVHYDELRLKGVFHHTPAYFAQALELITNHRIDVEALITERVPLSSALTVVEKLLLKQGVKYALIPPAFAADLLPPASHPQ